MVHVTLSFTITEEETEFTVALTEQHPEFPPQFSPGDGSHAWEAERIITLRIESRLGTQTIHSFIFPDGTVRSVLSGAGDITLDSTGPDPYLLW